MGTEKSSFQRGIFCFSFDFELAWGNFDRWDREKLEIKCRIARESVLPRLLEILQRHSISATWAVVGHLMLGECAGCHGNPTPKHSWFPEWYAIDPKGRESEHPGCYSRSFLRKLAELIHPQDIGLHGFSHCIWGDPGCSAAVAAVEMDNALRAAAGLNITPKSFVFPRNSIGHLDVLAASGIRIFRDRRFSKFQNSSPPIRRGLHFVSQFVGLGPPTVMPRTDHGMVCIPFSSLYPSMDGIRRLISVPARVKRAVKGMKRAFLDRGVYHLTTHPVYLAYEDTRTEKLLEGLEHIFAQAASFRDRGELDTLNMHQIAMALEETASL